MSAPTFAQETVWRGYIDDGSAAYKAGRYAESEKLLKLAVAEAEKFGPADPATRSFRYVETRCEGAIQIGHARGVKVPG